MKKDRIKTICIREIKGSYKRFISLLVMSLLGVGVFIGIKMASPDMLKSLDYYFDKTNTYDIKILSTLGLTNEDISSLKKVEGVNNVYGSYSKDVVFENNGNEIILKVHSISGKNNEISLTGGKLPGKNNEVVVEDYFLVKENLKLGDKIVLKDEETFNETNLTIVGTIKSPLYINSSGIYTRGSTKLGSGKINYYVYVNDSNFNIDYYTEIYLTVKSSKEKITNSKDYNELIQNCLSNINKIVSERENARYLELYNNAESDINKKELENLEKFDVAKDKLTNSSIMLYNAKTLLDENKVKLDNVNNELSNMNLKLESSKQELDLYNIQLNFIKEKIKQSEISINDLLKQYSLTINDINDSMQYLQSLKITKEKLKQQLSVDSIYYEEIINLIDIMYDFELENEFINFIIGEITKEEIIKIISDKLEEYDYIISEIDVFYNSDSYFVMRDYIVNYKYVDEIIQIIPKDILHYENLVILIENYKQNSLFITKLIESVNEVNKMKDEYNNGVILYNVSKQEYDNGYINYLNYYNEYENRLSDYNNGLRQYNNNYNLYSSKLEEYNNSKKIFELEIANAKEELKNIPKATWYVYDRTDNSGYSSFISDGQSVSNLSELFPSIFYIVAILISLISMSRMVEEDRMQIGTLKSLGFSNKDIRKKYILYSGSATLIGGIVGSILGYLLLPLYIFNMYKLMYDVPNFKYDFDIISILFGIVLAIISICGTTLLTIRKILKKKPSELMRPKAPVQGKRIILEKFKFLWNRIKFSNKITIRNIFRYKKRVIMTIFGISGCTAIMLVGFGIRDSIIEVPHKQYKQIYNFDEMVYLSKETSDEFVDNIFSDSYIENKIKTYMTSIMVDTYSVNLFVIDKKENINDIIELKDLKTKKVLSIKENEIIISDKLSDIMNKRVGDYLVIKLSDIEEYKLKISAICENYVGHYVFMDKKTYENYIGKYNTNVVYLNLNKENYDISKKLLKNENVIGTISSDDTMKNISDSLSSLNSVVILLIFLSGALSFVVLYNLSNINVSERKREISTLKVLGFSDKEVNKYITKETIILTIIGILGGLIIGTFLTYSIVDTIEVESVRFLRNVNLFSYIITFIIMMFFATIVNKIINFSLKRIDMIESLKSVE